MHLVVRDVPFLALTTTASVISAIQGYSLNGFHARCFQCVHLHYRWTILYCLISHKNPVSTCVELDGQAGQVDSGKLQC